MRVCECVCIGPTADIYRSTIHAVGVLTTFIRKSTSKITALRTAGKFSQPEKIVSTPRTGLSGFTTDSAHSRPANLENVFRGTFRVKKRDLPAKIGTVGRAYIEIFLKVYSLQKSMRVA